MYTSAMRNKIKCLVVGGSGFLGSDLIIHLINNKFDVIGFCRNPIPENLRKFIGSGELTWKEGDYSNKEQIEEIINEIDYLFHLACDSVPKTSNENIKLDLKNNLIPSIQLIEMATAAKIKKFIFYSSGGAIYGNQGNKDLSENCTLQPISSYGIHKLTIEKYLSLYEYIGGLNYSIMRVGNPYGTNKNQKKGHGVVGVFLEKIKKNELIEIWGDGTIVRDYIHVQDIADAAIKIINYQGKFRVFNIGSGVGFSINDLLEIMIKNTKNLVKITYLDKRVVDVEKNILDITLAKKELGWKPNNSIDLYIKNYLNEEL
jgi:UDP-glucose 4-epimerase